MNAAGPRHSRLSLRNACWLLALALAVLFASPSGGGGFGIGAALAPALAAHAAQPSVTADYLDLIDEYWRGSGNVAVQTLSDRDDKWVAAAQTAAVRTARTWPQNRLLAAALLHTEVVAGGWVLPSHTQTHLTAAKRFMELSSNTRASSQFRRDWLLAIAWHFQSELEFGALVPWLDELRTRFPEDAEVLLATGIFYETLGWTPNQPADLTASGRSSLLAAVSHRTQREAYEAAAVAYRRAVQTPATHDQASVRLGRVLAELVRVEEATAVLTPLVTSADERRWRYLAALFIAVAESRTGRTDAAAAAYEHAADLLSCQTPRIGIMSLRQLQGDSEQAASMARSLAMDESLCDDPWWFYRFGQPPDRLPRLLASMREALRP